MASLRTRLFSVAAVSLLPLAACGGSSGGNTTTPTAGAANTVTVHAKDSLEFNSETFTATAGTINFDYINDGGNPHTLLVDGHESAMRLSVGTEDTGSIDLPAGTYTIYCDVPGHRAAGMQATLTVSAG